MKSLMRSIRRGGRREKEVKVDMFVVVEIVEDDNRMVLDRRGGVMYMEQ